MLLASLLAARWLATRRNIGERTGIPRGLAVAEPYDSLSFVPTVFALTGGLQRDNTPDAALGNRGFLKFPGRVISEVAGQEFKPDAGAPV